MKTNIGDIDRIARVVVGGALLMLFFFGPRSALGLLGLIPIATAAVGYCPLYKMLGISTNPLEKDA